MMIGLDYIKASKKSRKEAFSFNDEETPFKLEDFWQWSMSDLLSNATRGILAEFIVATAIGLDKYSVRNEWDAYDLETKDGIKIEVKTSAYVQSWYQKDYSKITFSIKPARYWDPKTNILDVESKRHADIYVFCLLNHKDQNTINPLQLDQWEFIIAQTSRINTLFGDQGTLSLNSLRKHFKTVNYEKLNHEIRNIHNS